MTDPNIWQTHRDRFDASRRIPADAVAQRTIAAELGKTLADVGEALSLVLGYLAAHAGAQPAIVEHDETDADGEQHDGEPDGGYDTLASIATTLSAGDVVELVPDGDSAPEYLRITDTGVSEGTAWIEYALQVGKRKREPVRVYVDAIDDTLLVAGVQLAGEADR